ncbi:hypothetical protein [Vulcanococcus sp.]|jgi:uncharacterized protein YecT (DUF1311 family)|uniref:hypothetical protein n=1 Tax=Vulcanococcus sp. TaxID=2856995 RepID=UPI0037DA7610
MARLVSAIRCGIAAAGALALASRLPAQANPIDCSQAFSTVELSVCTRANLERKDVQLKQAMQAVARDAAEMPGGTFLPIWTDSLTGFFNTTTDPLKQFEAFKAARATACVYMNSLALQGTGFGIFVANCEIKLTDVLLEKLGN